MWWNFWKCKKKETISESTLLIAKTVIEFPDRFQEQFRLDCDKNLLIPLVQIQIVVIYPLRYSLQVSFPQRLINFDRYRWMHARLGSQTKTKEELHAHPNGRSRQQSMNLDESLCLPLSASKDRDCRSRFLISLICQINKLWHQINYLFSVILVVQICHFFSQFFFRGTNLGRDRSKSV